MSIEFAGALTPRLNRTDTMKRIQSVLPFGNSKPHHTMTLAEMAVRGFWLCPGCNQTIPHPIQGENGQPDRCPRCLSPMNANHWHKPALEAA